MRGQPLRHVVRVQDRDLGGPLEALRPHHRHVRPGDGQDAGAAEGGGRDRPQALRGDTGHRVAGKEGGEVSRHRDRPHAGSTSPVRDAERLVQVQVADIGSHVGGAGEADLGVHVRAVHVDLAAPRVDDRAHLLDRLLEHPVGGGIGDHEHAQRVLVGLGLREEIRHLDVSLIVAGHCHHLEAGHHRARGIRAVGADRDQADVALALAPARVPGPDAEQPCVLALGP